MKLLILLFTLSLAAPALSQDKIEGIGIFKIGKMQIADLEKYMAENNLSINKINTFRESVYVKEGKVNELFVNREKLTYSPSHSSFCDRSRVFQLGSYEVAGIKMSDIFLTFYDNVLIDMNCKPSDEMVEAIKTKYGEPVRTSNKSTKECQTAYGTKELEEENFYNKWQNVNITATYALLSYYDSDCKHRILEYFHIADEKLSSAQRKCSDSSKIKVEQEVTDQKKAGLKDF